MTTQDWVNKALEDRVWDIGQLDANTKKALNNLVAAGHLVKYRDRFCGISHPKTVWSKPQ